MSSIYSQEEIEEKWRLEIERKKRKKEETGEKREEHK
jgi:hypothetical protein